VARTARLLSWRLPHDLSDVEHTRRLGILAILVNNLLMNFGFSIIIPLIAVHYTALPGFTAAAIGTVLALRQMAQQGLDLVGGMIADRIGARTSIVVGCLVRAAGFLGIGLATSMPELVAMALLAGVGGAFFDAPGTAALADLVMPEARQRVYALSATLANVGTFLGPIAGVWLLHMSWQAVGIASAGVFVTISLLTRLLLPAHTLRREKADHLLGVPGRSALRQTLSLLLRDRIFLQMTALTTGYWFLSTQINISVPLVAASLGGPRMVAVVFSVYAGMAIVLQYPVVRYLGARFSARVLLGASTACAGLGLALAVGMHSILPLLIGIGLFAVARLQMQPTVNWVTSELAPQGQLGAYFGFGALSVAIGAGVGQITGGALYDLSLQLHQPFLLAGTLLLVAAITSTGLLRAQLPVGHRRVEALETALEPETEDLV